MCKYYICIHIMRIPNANDEILKNGSAFKVGANPTPQRKSAHIQSKV